MLTKEQMIYSRAAAARILAVKPEQILKLEIWPKVVLVRVEGSKPKFISKKTFLEDFVNSRKARARNLRAKFLSPGTFLVPSETTDKVYKVREGKQFTCECQDWANQKLAGIHNATCKHIYAVIFSLGFNSLREYMDEKNRSALGGA